MLLLLCFVSLSVVAHMETFHGSVNLDFVKPSEWRWLQLEKLSKIGGLFLLEAVDTFTDNNSVGLICSMLDGWSLFS